MTNAWLAKFDTVDDKLKTLLAVLDCHPYMPVENLSYNRNFVHIIKDAFPVLDKLGPHQHTPEVGACLRIGADYYQTSNLTYDSEKMQMFQVELRRSFEYLFAFKVELVDIEKDLIRLRSEVVDKAGDDVTNALNKLFYNLSKFSTLLYDVDGKARYTSLTDDFMDSLRLTEGGYENLYCDLFPQHLAP